MLKVFLVPGFLLTALFGAALSIDLRAAAPTIPSDVQSSIRQRVDYGYCPSIVVGVVNADGRAFYSYGKASLETGSPANEQTLFEVGSITKVLTATLLAAMVENGDVALTDSAESLLNGQTVPSFNGANITLLHLATHASGLPYIPPNMDGSYLHNPFAQYDLQHLHDFLDTYVLPRNPGSQYEYSNVGFGLLGHALALRANSSYEQALKQLVLTPLGMRDTTLTLSAEQTARRAVGYSGVAVRPPFFMNSLAAAGDAVSSAAEMLTFLEYHCGIRSHALAPVFANTTRLRRATDMPGISIGLGWWMFNNGSGDILMHGGNTVGQTAFIGYRRNSKRAVVALTNARVNEFANIQDIGLRLIDSAFPLTSIRRPPTVSETLLSAYSGIYKAEDGTWLSIDRKHGFLTITASQNTTAAFTFVPQSSTRFTILEPGAAVTATFSTNAAGQATNIRWVQNGVTVDYPRVADVPRLKITRAAETKIELTGASSIDLILETTSDFQMWHQLSDTFNNEGYVASGDTPASFYRAKLPSP